MRFGDNGYWQMWLNAESKVEREEQARVNTLARVDVYAATRTKPNLGTDYSSGCKSISHGE